MSTPPVALSATLSLGEPLSLELGGQLERCHIAFRRYGDPSLPLVIVLGGISATRHVTCCREDVRPGWWEPVVGDGRAIDINEYSVLGIDYLGRGTRDAGRDKLTRESGSIDHELLAPCAVTRLATHDQARAIAAVLDRLGVEQAHAIVGASYGGMVALAFAELFPHRLAHAVVISAAHRTHPMATALRSIQRGVVRLGMETGRPQDGLRVARQLAMTTYRTAEELGERFDAEPVWSDGTPRFPVECWLEKAGTRFADAFTAESFLALSESIDLHRVDPQRICAPVTLIAVETDTLVPLWQMRELRERLPLEPDWYVVESIYGHDAFLKEVEAMSAIIGRTLKREATTRFAQRARWPTTEKQCLCG